MTYYIINIPRGWFKGQIARSRILKRSTVVVIPTQLPTQSFIYHIQVIMIYSVLTVHCITALLVSHPDRRQHEGDQHPRP